MSLNDCEWVLNEDNYDDVCYETSCGKTFIILEGTPKDNDMFYCCYCGKPLIEETRKSND